MLTEGQHISASYKQTKLRSALAIYFFNIYKYRYRITVQVGTAWDSFFAITFDCMRQKFDKKYMWRRKIRCIDDWKLHHIGGAASGFLKGKLCPYLLEIRAGK